MAHRNKIYCHVRSNAVAYVALFLALGGAGAWAADKITSKDIAKNAVRAKHVKKNAVKTPKIKDSAVTAAKLADDVDIPAATLWANVVDSAGGPTLIRGSGVASVANAGTGQVRVSFDRNVQGCSYQATGWLEHDTGDEQWAEPPIMNVESFEDTRTNFVEVQAYTRSTGDLDSDGYEFTLAVFC